MRQNNQFQNAALKLFLTIALFVFSAPAHASNVHKVNGWNEELPISSKVILAELRAEAAYLSYETDELVCGGNIISPELVDAEELKNADGTTAYNLRVRFQVTKAINYCADESEMTCEVPFQVSGQNDVVMGNWSCN